MISRANAVELVDGGAELWWSNVVTTDRATQVDLMFVFLHGFYRKIARMPAKMRIPTPATMPSRAVLSSNWVTFLALEDTVKKFFRRN